MTESSPTQAAVVAAYGVALVSLDRWATLRGSCIVEVQQAVDAGQLNVGFALELARLPADGQAEVFALGLSACRAVARELRGRRLYPRPRCSECGQPIRASGGANL